MIPKRALPVLLLPALLLALQPAAAAAQIHWADWTTLDAAGGTAAGQIFGSAVSYQGSIPLASPSRVDGGGINYWDYPVYDVPNRPGSSDILAISGTGTHVISFATPVVNPFLAIVSMGQPGLPVSYQFADVFSIVSVGPGYWGNGTLTGDGTSLLVGAEGHGVIQFTGTFSELSWASSPNEYWHGFTVGAPATTTTPEPVSLVLLGSGLIGLAGMARRRRQRGHDA